MKLNRNTKKARGFVQQYTFSNKHGLSECYTSYSYAKAVAEVNCRKKMNDMDGFGLKIMSFNSQTFTCGWLYQDKETGDIMLNVETAYNSYQILYHKCIFAVMD